MVVVKLDCEVDRGIAELLLLFIEVVLLALPTFLLLFNPSLVATVLTGVLLPLLLAVLVVLLVVVMFFGLLSTFNRESSFRSCSKSNWLGLVAKEPDLEPRGVFVLEVEGDAVLDPEGGGVLRLVADKLLL